MDWKQAGKWTTTHPVGRVFTDISIGVLDSKEQGACVPAAMLGTDEISFLTAARDRLERAMGFKTTFKSLLPKVGDDLSEEAQRWLRLMAVGRSGDLGRWRREGRDYLLTQHAAMTVTSWPDPERAILYCAAQHAVHDVVDLELGNDEPQQTKALIDSLSGILRHRFVPAMRHPGPSLPAGSFLSVTTASMTNVKDRMGADLAVAIGSVVNEEDRYRVSRRNGKMPKDGEWRRFFPTSRGSS